MDPVERDLKNKLSQKSLTPDQVQEGITACFILTNRQFLQHRIRDSRPQEEIDAVTKELVSQVYAEMGISPASPNLSDLRQAWHTLDAQLGFEVAPELLAHHAQIIQKLFNLAGK